MKKNKLKIIFVSNTSWFLYNFYLPLMKDLKSVGCEVIAFSPVDSYVKNFRKNGFAHINIKMTRSGVNPLEDVILTFKFARIFRRHKPDLVQMFTIKPNIYGTIAARMAKIRNIYNMITGLGYVFIDHSIKKIFLRKITILLYRFAMPHSTHVYFLNSEDADYFIKHKIVNTEKVTIIPSSGVDTQFFTPVKKKRKKTITFILVARMLWDKGIKEFVDAARQLKKKYDNASFWLLGPVDLKNPRGILRDQLEAWNKEGVVEYLGMTDNVKSYLEKADVIVMPSFREGIPTSLLEGAAMEMPIITADSVGCRETVKNGVNGYLVPPRDSKALASAMEKFIIDPKAVLRMGKESRNMVVKKFDVRKTNKELLKFYPFQV